MRVSEIRSEVVSCKADGNNAGSIIAHERKIVALSEQFMSGDDYGAFAEVQQECEEVYQGRAPASVTPIRDAVQCMRELLGVPDRPADRRYEVTRVMVAATPFLRSRILFSNPAVNLEGATRAQGAAMDRTRIPFAMACIYLIAEAAGAAGMKRVSFQTVSRLATEFRPLVHMLSHLDQVMVWKRGELIDPRGLDSQDSRLRFVRIAKALLPGSQERTRTPVGEVLLRYAPSDPVARVVFIKQVAGLLAGRLVIFDELRTIPAASKAGTVVRCAAQRWALTHLTDERVLIAYGPAKRT
jgi:negative regulator of replication initiation